jgi:hypothetical protein
MTRSRRAPGGATRARLLGCVLALVGLLAGAAACADVGRGDAAAGHGLVLRADGPRTDVLDGPRAGGPQADAPPDDGLRADAPLLTDCSAAHLPDPDTPAGDCPASAERAPAAPLFGPGPAPAPGGPAHAATSAATAVGGVGPPSPSAVGSPCLHELQVQRT